jgi:hypothetical protein
MSDTVDDFRALDDYRKRVRRAFGVPCPVCRQLRPLTHAKILEPQQTCRAHKPHYRDPRPELTQADINTALGCA